MTSAPSPNWYPDPSNPAQLRWWDGQAWTAATTTPATSSAPVGGTVGGPAAAAPPAAAGQPSGIPSYQSSGYGQPVYSQPPAPTGGTLFHRNQLAFITLGIVAVYIVIALSTHLVMLGVLPAIMTFRSFQRREPLAPVAAAAAGIAIVVAVIALSGN